MSLKTGFSGLALMLFVGSLLVAVLLGTVFVNKSETRTGASAAALAVGLRFHNPGFEKWAKDEDGNLKYVKWWTAANWIHSDGSKEEEGVLGLFLPVKDPYSGKLALGVKASPDFSEVAIYSSPVTLPLGNYVVQVNSKKGEGNGATAVLRIIRYDENYDVEDKIVASKKFETTDQWSKMSISFIAKNQNKYYVQLTNMYDRSEAKNQNFNLSVLFDEVSIESK